MTEAQEQRTVIEYCEWKRIPVFHVPNGGQRNIHTAAQLKKQGVKAGVPDLFFPVAKQNYHGLFVEMKRTKGGTVSKHQQKWLDLLNANGYRAVVCHGAGEAIREINRYFSVDVDRA